jgi:K+-transporting ATPase A subunit
MADFLDGVCHLGNFDWHCSDEYGGNSQVNNLLGAPQPNLEGKEVRFGWAETALWAVTTTGTMCGLSTGCTIL